MRVPESMVSRVPVFMRPLARLQWTSGVLANLRETFHSHLPQPQDPAVVQVYTKSPTVLKHGVCNSRFLY